MYVSENPGCAANCMYHCKMDHLIIHPKVSMLDASRHTNSAGGGIILADHRAVSTSHGSVVAPVQLEPAVEVFLHSNFRIRCRLCRLVPHLC